MNKIITFIILIACFAMSDNLKVTSSPYNNGQDAYEVEISTPQTIKNQADIEISVGKSVSGATGNVGNINLTPGAGSGSGSGQVKVIGTLFVSTNELIGNQGYEASGILVDGSTANALLQLSDISGTSARDLVIHQHSTSGFPEVTFALANSNTAGHATVNVGQTLGAIRFSGNTGRYANNYQSAVIIRALVDPNGVVTTASVPGMLQILTERDFNLNPTGNVAFQVDSLGLVSCNNLNVDGNLTVNGTVSANDFATVGLTSYASPNSTVVGFSALTTNLIKYRKVGKTVTVWFDLEGTSGSASFTFTLPYTNNVGDTIYTSIAYTNNGTAIASGYGTIPNNSNTITLTSLNGAWAGSGNKQAIGTFTYYTTQ